MKTAISIPDSIYEAAERLAGRLGMSRSKLYATAVAEFLEAHRDSGVTRALDSVYSNEDSRIDDRWLDAQAEALPEDW